MTEQDPKQDDGITAQSIAMGIAIGVVLGIGIGPRWTTSAWALPSGSRWAQRSVPVPVSLAVETGMGRRTTSVFLDVDIADPALTQQPRPGRPGLLSSRLHRLIAGQFIRTVAVPWHDGRR